MSGPSESNIHEYPSGYVFFFYIQTIFHINNNIIVVLELKTQGHIIILKYSEIE